MKILNLCFTNLNSLKGTWHIDFTDKAFDDSIFAIVGQTGSGKTTILDAICLAIYGQTPRIQNISNTQNELMSMDTGECCATVELTVGQKMYRFYWGQWRAGKKPDGKLQPIKREIHELHYPYEKKAHIIENKAKLCHDKAIEIMHMDFKQFTRSVMLAQGEFSAFLKAQTNEKDEILEQITGTEIYGKISAKVFAIAKQKNEHLKNLKDKLADNIIMSDDDYLALTQTINHQKNQFNDHKIQLEIYDSHITNLHDKEQKEQHIKQLEQQINESQKAIDEFAQDEERLYHANQALKIEPIYQKIQQT